MMNSKTLRKHCGISKERLNAVEQCVEMLPDLQEFFIIGLDQANNLVVKSTIDVNDMFYLMDMVKHSMAESLKLQEQGKMN